MSRLLPLTLGLLLALVEPTPCVAQPATGSASNQDRITLDADGILLSQAVQMIIRNREVSLVTGETLDQTVTVKFTNIPWRDALSSLLKSHGFTILEEQNVLRVVRLANDSDSPQPRMPLVVRFKHLSAAAARDLLTPMLSPNGRIVALGDESAGGAISVVDVPEVLEMVRNLVPDIDVAPENSSATMTRHDDGTATFSIRNFPLGDLPAALNDQLDLNVFLNTSVSGVVNANLKRVPVELIVERDRKIAEGEVPNGERCRAIVV
ncbi:MAG: secretin N-terminal domain-containing protein, partial [Planctomycetota bacterium]